MSVNDCALVTDVELLKTEMETFWAADDRGRIQGPDHLVIAAAACGQAVAIGSEMPDTLANDLQRTVARLPATSDPAMPPASLERCKELLRDAVGALEVSSGPSYLIPPTVAYEPTAALEQSAPANAETVAGASPRSWSVEEGDELLGGACGP